MSRAVTLKLKGGPLDGTHYAWDSARKGEFPIDIPVGALGIYRKVYESANASPNQRAHTEVIYNWVEGGS